MNEKIMAACGNDCSACPRYIKEPYVKTEAELAHTAELWYKIGYRDHVVTNEEISCTGCKEDNWCRYKVVKCTNEKQIEHCGQCSQFPCDNIRECFEVTKSFEPFCKQVCTAEEYELMSKAFFEKEKNLNLANKEKSPLFAVLALLERDDIEGAKTVFPQNNWKFGND